MHHPELHKSQSSGTRLFLEHHPVSMSVLHDLSRNPSAPTNALSIFRAVSVCREEMASRPSLQKVSSRALPLTIPAAGNLIYPSPKLIPMLDIAPSTEVSG